MKYYRFLGIALVGAFVFIILGNQIAPAAEPRRPEVTKSFSPEKESKVQALASRSTKAAFDGLKAVEFLVNKDLTHKAVYAAFNHRKVEALNLARNYLKLPFPKFDETRRANRVRDFNIAKKIFEVFPDESTPLLTNLYRESDSFARGNIIRAAGGVAGGESIKKLLIEALGDKSFAEDETPDMVGEPLRVCDEAYNQLVLRYRVTNVLRTITQAHDIATRDHHIDILKQRFPAD